MNEKSTVSFETIFHAHFRATEENHTGYVAILSDTVFK